MALRFLSLLLLVGFAASAAIADWIPLAPDHPSSTPVVEVERAAADAWDVHVAVAGIHLESYTIAGQGQFDFVALEPNAAVGAEDFTVPELTRIVGLLQSGEPTLEVLHEDWTELEAAYLLLMRQYTGGLTEFQRGAAPDEFLPATAATISPRQVLGGVGLATIRIQPVRYNPAQHRIQVLREASFRIRESGAPTPANRQITETTAGILRAVVPNWSELSLDDNIVRGTLLYIVADHSTVQNGIQELVNWRMRKGYTVEIAGPLQIPSWTTTGVKNYIQQRYNSANPPLEFVCLVGDANGSYVIPYYTYSGGPGDWDYTRLDGNDLLPDVAIGRLPFQDGAGLAKIVNKTLRYEQTPAAAGSGTKPNWYQAGGLFVGSGSYLSGIQTLRWVRARMLENGFASSSIDTVYYTYESVNSTKMNNSINAGALIWCYRGYLGMSGYTTSNVSGLTNVGHWPFILNLTCGTNDFAGYDVCEAFLYGGGSVSSPTGAVGVVGMSSTATHTRFNNLLMSGYNQALLREGISLAGAALSRTKLELYRSYPVDSSNVALFCGITSLMGEPVLDIHTATPDTLFIDNPPTIPIGTNYLSLTVRNNSGLPVENAFVNLLKGTEVFVSERTDGAGRVVFNFATTTAETLFVTATKHNFRPAINFSRVIASTRHVTPAAAVYTIDDDNTGTSQGDGSGTVNPGESIELAIPLRNWGTSSVSGVTATLATTDPFVTAITDNAETYGTIAAGATVNPGDDFDFSVAGYFPDGHVAQFTLTVTDGSANTWISLIPIPFSNANLEYASHTLTGAGNGILDPGESAQITLTLLNAGTRTSPGGAAATLRCANRAVIVTDSSGAFTAANPGGACTNAGNTFAVAAQSTAFPGERIPFECIFPLTSGFADTVRFNVIIGSIASAAPTPPDAYGYWAFDNTDILYAKHPTYTWFEIDPRYGGLGTAVQLVDEVDEGDQSTVVALPFTFRYYGQDFDAITICTNGWLAMGAEQVVHTDFRNYAIPSTIGPSNMIAPFWDDLRVQSAAASAMRNAPTEKSEGEDTPRSPGARLDEGGDDCANAVVIASLPYADTGNTCDNTNQCGGTSRDVFYRYSVPAGGQRLTASLCSGTNYDSYLRIYSACCTSELAYNDDFCGLNSEITRDFVAGDIWIMVEGYGNNCGSYTLTVDAEAPPVPAGIYTYHDAANHRYIVQWSRVFKWNNGSNPQQTFQCILYEPGYPATWTGDGEILFQYMTCTNTTDVSTSNNYATVGIENADQTDGVVYSYFNRVSPQIPGAATMTSGRAILFTTQKLPVDTPRVPTGLTAILSGDNVELRWNPVTEDVQGNPLPAVQYRIYRGSTASFPIDGTTYLATVAATTYLDPVSVGPARFYVVQVEVPGTQPGATRGEAGSDRSQ